MGWENEHPYTTQMRQAAAEREYHAAETRKDAADFELAAAVTRNKPHVIYHVKVYNNGEEWIAAYSDDKNTVKGRGSSPAAACEDFDTKWTDNFGP